MTDELKSELLNLKNNLSHHKIAEKKMSHHVGLLIGPTNGGKTSLLNQTEHTLNQTISQTGTECNTWFSQKATFIELHETISNNALYLTNYIRTIKKYSSRKTIDSISICLNIYDGMLLPPTRFIQNLIKIRKSIDQNKKQLKKTKLFIVFTHMDRIAGFCHSFENTDTACGYNFTPYPNQASLIKQNENKYRQFIKDLHETLIPRLHVTTNTLTRYLIREFPLQMESLSNMVRASIKHLSSDTLITTGLFFTSSQQGNSAHDRLSANITKTYALAVSSSIPQSSRETVFFVNGCINKIIEYQSEQSRYINTNYAFYATCASILIGIALSIHHLRSNSLLNQANQELFFYQHSQSENLNEFTNALEHLNKAHRAANNLSNIVSLSHLSKFRDHIQTQYAQGLNNQFLPVIAKQLEQVLGQRLTPKESYYTLKTYLMLGDRKQLDETYLKAWLNTFWKENKIVERPKLNKLLNLALKKPFQGIALNHTIINNIRSYLQALPDNYLYYSLIKEYLPKQADVIKLSFFNINEINIPFIYQKNNFTHVYEKLLPEYANVFQHDNFVLGKENRFDPTKILQHTYLANYKSWWKKLSQNTMPLTFTTYADAESMFKTFASSGSPLERLRQLIQSNTSPYANTSSPAEVSFNHQITQEFTSFNFFTNNQATVLQPIFSDLAHYFLTLNTARNSDEAAFNIARSRFIKRQVDPMSQLYELDSQLPAPLKTWITQLNNNAWNLILQNTQVHINEQWKALVYSEYQDNILGHFPFQEQSKKEVSEVDFNHFFGHQGRLALFFDYYLKPFLDTSKAKWQVKPLDGLQLPMHNTTITELIRANVIREMFFRDQSDTPQVKFTLNAIALEPIVKKFTININGQQLSEAQNQKHSLSVTWPGNKNDKLTQIIVNDISGKSFQFNEQGFWGWFKLLSKSNKLALNQGTQNYQLILDVNGNAGKFLLTAEKPLNPFIPGILEKFRLPKELT